MTEEKPRLIPTQPWENGWAPDTSRVPGTRRLWMAGTLALSVVAACVTAIVVTERQAEDPAPVAQAPVPSPGSTYPGLLTFASPSATGAAPPSGKSGLSSAQPTAPAAAPAATTSVPVSVPAPDVEGSASAPASAAPEKPAASPSPSKSSAAPAKPASLWRSVQSANYPSRYWHVDDGLVKLDPVRGSESRADSTFKVVKGLADSSCYSFATASGTYLRHRSFVLRADRNDGSSLFKKDATFCARGSSVSGATMLESVNYPGYYLRHRNFQVRLDRFEFSGQYMGDSAFKVVAALSD